MRACPIGAVVENDIFCISQGTVATFFRCGGQVSRGRQTELGHLATVAREPLTVFITLTLTLNPSLDLTLALGPLA